MEGRPHNRILQSLSDQTFALLALHLKMVPLPVRHVLFRADDEIDSVYFPTAGVVSIVVPLSGGETVEVAMTGFDGAVGSGAAFGNLIAPNEAIVQVAGSAARIGAKEAQWVAQQASDLQHAFYQWERYLLAQAQRAAACNARHEAHARLARWLLRCRDLVRSEELNLTQEFIATMLGVRRTTVTEILIDFEKEGLIRHKRARYLISDVPGMQATACECHAALKSAEKIILSEAGRSASPARGGDGQATQFDAVP
jgi:CRP-like cAMP-binding protein